MNPTPYTPLWYWLGITSIGVLLFCVWVAWRALRAHQRIVAALHGQARSQRVSSPTKLNWAWIPLSLGICLLWTGFWLAQSHPEALILLPVISAATLLGSRRLQAQPVAAWRLWLAAPLHLGGCLLFLLERWNRWESSALDNLAYRYTFEWERWAEATALPWLHKTLHDSDCALRWIRGDVAGEWATMEGWPLAIFAIACWVAAGVLTFGSRKVELLPSSLLWLVLFFLPAYVAVERGDLGVGAVSTQSGKPLSALEFSLAEQRVLDQAYSLGDASVRRVRFEVVSKTGERLGRLHVYSAEARYPWQRWRFDLLDGPRRTQPRLTYFLLENEKEAPGELYAAMGRVWRAPLNQVEGWATRQREALGLTELR